MDMMNCFRQRSKVRSDAKLPVSKLSALSGLNQVIFTDSPNIIQEVPNNLRELWNYRHELAVENGVIFKRKQVFIHQPLRSDILAQLHIRHEGIEKSAVFPVKAFSGLESTRILRICATVASYARNFNLDK